TAGTSAPVPGLSFADLAAPACFALSLPVLAGFAFGSAALAGLVCGFVAPGQFLPALFPPRDRSAPPPHAPHPALQAAAFAALAAAPLLAGYDAQLLDVLRPAFRDLDIRIPASCHLRPFDAVWTTAIAVSLLGVIVAALRLRPAAVSRRKS
ncbi:MAG: hypothetical protein HUU15_10800, partial [Candidatus Brocadiae bacterium]|nr:hypothetical protein [Candidatus Brocadiia bacterium]